MCLGIYMSIIGCFIFISEITIFLDYKLSIFGYLIRLSEDYYYIKFVSMLPLISIWYIVYFGLFHLNIGGYCAMNKPYQTDSPSLIFATMFFNYKEILQEFLFLWYIIF